MSNFSYYSNKSRNVGLTANSWAASRGSRFTRRESVDEIHLDYKQDPRTVIGEILRNVSRKEGITKGRRLAYLNAFVKYLQKNKTQAGGSGDSAVQRNLGFNIEQIFLCLRVCLVHEATVIRMAALRVLRYLVVSEEDLAIMNSTQIPYLVVRSMDIVLNNSGERTQATRLCQRILAIPNGAAHFPCAITRALVAIGFDGQAEQDKLYRGSLSLLCQLALLNPMQFIECGGVRVLLHNILGCTSPMVLEAMIGSLLHLLNVPETRDAAGVNLQSLVAPFTDVHFKHSGHEPSDRDLDEREVGYQCAKTAIGTVLRSWSGIAHFCQSRNSGLQALIDALYIEQLEIRRTILDLICEIVGVKFPTWSDEVSVALSAVDPSNPQDSWRLQDGFIVQEALSVLPHLAVSTPNVTANHMALIVFSFIQRGLLEALVEVIVTGDTFISVRGTVLLGELLSLVDRYIPLDCYDPSQCIPTLIRYSAGTATSVPSPPPQKQPQNQPSQKQEDQRKQSQSKFASTVTPEAKQQRAMEAISVLSSLQKIKSRPPSPQSVFLQAQLQYAGFVSKRHGKFMDRLGQAQLSRVLKREMEGNPMKLLKDSGVLNSKDTTTWQWDTIFTLIKWAPSSLKRVDDSSWRSFLKRLIDYFKPSNNKFSKAELGKGQAKLLAKIGCALVQFMAEEVDNFTGSTLLEELLVDIASQLDQLIRQSKNPYSCFFSPSKLESTLSQTYFLFIGKLTHSVKGYKVLEKGDILRRFYDIICEVQHDCYVKLIVSSLSYREEFCKRILGAALTCSFDGSRLYATQFLRVLVRAKLTGFSKWGMELLVNQLNDKNKIISLTALDILEEAIHDKMFLESLISLRPTLSHLGDRGLLLLVCFLSLPSGYKFLLEANFLKNEIYKWKTSFNKRYVELVEVLVRDSVSTLRRGEDGKYPERASRNQEQCKFVDIYVPPHLYGQLAQHKDGLEMLQDFGDIDSLIEIVNCKRCKTPEETRELKAALWALAHLGTSVDAVQIIEDSRVLESMVDLGRFCPILSVRHTIFHCLCLICVTEPGAEILRKYGWYGMPRNHHENFTIWTPEYFLNDANAQISRLREDELLYPEECDEDAEKVSIADTCSNLLIEEEDAELFMMEEMDINPPIQMKESPSFELEDEEGENNIEKASTEATRKLSYVHHRSQSDSVTLGFSSKTSVESRADRTNENGRNGSGGAGGVDNVDIQEREESATARGGISILQPRTNSSASSIMMVLGGGSSSSTSGSGTTGRGRGTSFLRSGGGGSYLSGSAPSGGGTYTSGRSGSNGSWRWRKSRSDSVSDSTTSGVSSCDSSILMAGVGGRGVVTQPSAEHVQTLSPIPSSASIATTICSNPQLAENQSPPSRADSSRMTLTEPVGRFSFGSPSHLAYRSMKSRKPIIRMPMLSDSDIYPNQFDRRRIGYREPKTGSLDRHFILSPGDLFGESKLMRVNSSRTSLSTPSYRIRPESETKGPCFMGLCIPHDFQAIFLTDSSIPLHVRMTSFQDDANDGESKPLGFGDSFEYHSVSTCMGCLKLRDEDKTHCASEEETMMEAARTDSETEPQDTSKTSEKESASLPSTNNVKQSVVSIGSLVSIIEAGSVDGAECTRIVPDSPEGKTVIRKEVLRFVSNLISCVGAKANEQGLLRLKQKFPRAFQDLCLYSELCALMSRYNLRLPFRRFLQEVFFDLPFDEFYEVVSNILGDEEEESQNEASQSQNSSFEGAAKALPVSIQDIPEAPPTRRRYPSISENIAESIDEEIASSASSEKPSKKGKERNISGSSMERRPNHLLRQLGENSSDEEEESDIIDLK